MTTVQKPDARFLLLPMPEFSLLAFGGFLDKLRMSADEADHSQQRYCSWQILGLQSGQIASSSGARLSIDICADQIDWHQFDYLVLFGSRTAQQSQQLARFYGPLLTHAAKQGLHLASIDNGCFTLAETGLLKGYKVAVHWRHQQEFQVAYPGIQLANEQLYCIDGKRSSCAGGSAAIDLAVELIARHSGRHRAQKGLADMLVDESRSQLHQLRSQRSEQFLNRHIDKAVSLMHQHLAQTLSVDQIADVIGISRRQLDRLFQQQFQQSMRQYWLEMRLQHIHWRLLNSNHSLTVLADEVGFTDASHLAKQVRKRFGSPPSALRGSVTQSSH